MSDRRLRTLERAYRKTGSEEDGSAYAKELTRSGEEIPYNLRIRLTRLFTFGGMSPQGLPEYRHKTTGMVFVLVPDGEFMMGPTDEVGVDEKKPQQYRREFVEPFLMAKYPWTGRKWYRITGELPSHFPTSDMVLEVHPDYGNEDNVNQAPVPVTRMNLPDAHGRTWGDHPVESVSWDRCREVEDFINRIDFARWTNCEFTHSDQTFTLTWAAWEQQASLELQPLPVQNQALIFSSDVEKAYQAWLWNDRGERAGFQLPTEAMWEYTTRAGTNTRYPNGNTDEDLGKIAWFGGDWEDGHKAVGLKEPNNWGLHDNCGNVFEWTRCIWRQETEDEPVNGFLANGENRPDPTHFLNNDQIHHLVSVSSGQLDLERSSSEDTAGSSSTTHTNEGVSTATSQTRDADSGQPGAGPNELFYNTITLENLSPDPTPPSSPSPGTTPSTGQSDDRYSETGSPAESTIPTSAPDLLSRYADYDYMDEYPEIWSGIYSEDASPVSSDPTTPTSNTSAGTSTGPSGSQEPPPSSLIEPSEEGPADENVVTSTTTPGESGLVGGPDSSGPSDPRFVHADLSQRDDITRFVVYTDPNFRGYESTLLRRQGSSNPDTGFVFSPYVPLQIGGGPTYAIVGFGWAVNRPPQRLLHPFVGLAERGFRPAWRCR